MRLAALFGWIGQAVLPVGSGQKALQLIQYQLAFAKLKESLTS
jgi:hypothetical protein